MILPFHHVCGQWGNPDSWCDEDLNFKFYKMSYQVTWLLVAVHCCSAGVAVPARPKHFVVALVDDLGGYNVPWRNVEQTMSDDLLRLSTTEGMRLDNFYTFKYCSPTRSSFLSGRFPCHVNQNNQMPCPGCVGCDGGGIDLRMKLLPQKLGSSYRSYMVGKGHIGSRSTGHLPINRGFDHHLGFLGGGEDHWQCNGRRHSCDGNVSSTNGVHCQCAPKTAVAQQPAAPYAARPLEQFEVELAPPCSTLMPPFCTCTGGAGNPRNCSCAGATCAGAASPPCQICTSPSPPSPAPPKAVTPVDLWEDHAPAYGLNGTYSCMLYSGKAVALIEEHAANYAEYGMFLYVPYHDVHEPYEALDSYRDPAITDSNRQTMQAMVSCVSEGTGNVTRALKQARMWADTLLLWSSDNGGPQYWLGNNHPLRGGKGTDFEGGVSTAAFVSGGALPSHLYGHVSNSPIHLVDLHFTICLLAGVSEAGCRDDAMIDGVPPIDGVDFRTAFQEVNATRPVSRGIGPSAGTQEIVLSTNNAGSGGRSCNADLSLCGAYIDFNESNGGPWKFMCNTTTVIKNPSSPLGSGYWTPAQWPRNGNNHTPSEVDPGCPEGGCLFNLRLDRTERKEFSLEYPEVKARMVARMKILFATTFQSNATYTGGYDDCQSEIQVANELHGFRGVCCKKKEME